MKTKLLFASLGAILCLAIAPTALAQKIGAPTQSTSTHVKKAAVLPLMFFKDDEPSDNTTAINSFKGELDAVLEHYGITKMDQATVNGTWQQSTGQIWDDKQYVLPRPEDLVAFGKKMGVDYVVFSRLKWHVKSVWVGLGPKTKADATLDLWIIDIRASEFELKADSIKAGDTEKEPAWRTAGAILLTPIFTVVSGGPETPHMERAGVTALDKALEPWVTKQQNLKIGG